MNKVVVTRYPLPVRSATVFMCLVLGLAMARSPISAWTVVVAVVAVCLAIAVLAYKAEIDGTEVRVRHAPFFARRVPLRDVIGLVEEQTLVLVTPRLRIPLWGLSAEARVILYDVLPRHLDMLPPRAGAQGVVRASVRKHLRWTILLCIGFVATAALVIPFSKGNVWHEHWNSAGQCLLFLCLLFFIVLVAEAGFTWVLWSAKRGIDRIGDL